jgi:hypothetical protein
MSDKGKMSLGEFEALVDEVKGDCDRCRLQCLGRLQWMDNLVESLRYQLAKSLAMNRVLLKAAKLVAEDDYLDREIKRLTARILKEEAADKGPPDDNEKDIEQKLTHWN